MNKDLYITLLEEHVDDLTTAAEIDTMLADHKNEKLRRIDELLSKVVDTVLDCQDDLNDLQADWARDHRCLGNQIKDHMTDIEFADMTLREFEQENENLSDEGDRLRHTIKELKKRNSKLEKVNAELKEQAKIDEVTKDNLLKKVFELREKVRKLEDKR